MVDRYMYVLYMTHDSSQTDASMYIIQTRVKQVSVIYNTVQGNTQGMVVYRNTAAHVTGAEVTDNEKFMICFLFTYLAPDFIQKYSPFLW